MLQPDLTIRDAVGIDRVSIPVLFLLARDSTIDDAVITCAARNQKALARSMKK